MTTHAELWSKWTARLTDARQLHPLVSLEHVAAEVLADLQHLEQVEDDIVTIKDAALLSGYSEDTLRRMIADVKVPNAGRKNKPAIRRGDVPRKPGYTVPLPANTDGHQLDERRRIVFDARTRTTPPERSA